jgi:type 1 glutamine amidotransferase
VDSSVPSPHDESAASTSAPADSPLRLLVFTKTAGHRHGSIPVGTKALKRLAKRHGWQFEQTEDAKLVAAVDAHHTSVVVWLNTTGDVLDDEQQQAFERYIRAGGGYVGVHAAADAEYDWPFYGELCGAYFAGHPEIQSATIRVEDRNHPATRHLGSTLTLTDEWYNYRKSPRDKVRVLMALDEGSYRGGTMGDHPIAWAHENLGGRAFYTGLGHRDELFSDPVFLEHLSGGIRWAARREP